LADSGDREPLRRLPVHWSLSAHARRLLVLAVAAVILAVLTRRAEFAGLAAPALLLLSTWQSGPHPDVAVRIHLGTASLVEGVTAALDVEIHGHEPFDASLLIEPADAVLAGDAVHVPGGHPTRSAVLRVVPTRWGRYSLGVLVITFTDRYRLTEGTAIAYLPFVSPYPQAAPMESSVVLSRLPSRLGEHPARAAGEGVEFAGVREFVPGDRQRRINWPATTRLGSLHLSTFSAERTQNVVVIADETTDIGEPGTSSLDLVLRGASGAITRYLAARDRVGLIIFAGRLSWIAPGQGRRHWYRLLDLMISAPGGWDRASSLTRLPRAALPPGSLILVFSPLLDPRLVEALRDLRERGFSVIVIDVLNARPGHDGSRLSRLTARMWHLEQEAVRFSLTQIGVPVVHWDGVSSLDTPLAPYTRRVLVAHR